MIRTCKNSSFYTIHTLVTCHEIANQYQPILNVIHPYPSLSTPFRCLVVDVVLVIDLVIVVSLGRFSNRREAQDQCWTSSPTNSWKFWTKIRSKFQSLAASQEIGTWHVVINVDIPSPSHIPCTDSVQNEPSWNCMVLQICVACNNCDVQIITKCIFELAVNTVVYPTMLGVVKYLLAHCSSIILDKLVFSWRKFLITMHPHALNCWRALKNCVASRED